MHAPRVMVFGFMLAGISPAQNILSNNCTVCTQLD